MRALDLQRYAPRFDVRIAGLTLAADVTKLITSVSYDNNADIADMFTVTLLNPDNQLLDSALFDLGKTVEIHLGYGDELEPMMLGEITSLQPSFPEGGAPMLTVTGYDKSHRLRHNQPDRPAWKYTGDSLIAAQIAAEAGLIPVVDPSPFFHEEIQQTSSDFAFLKERAEANFFELFVHWDKLYFRFPRPQTEKVVLEWGKSLSSFSPRLSSAGMAGIQVIRGYNEQLAEAVVAFATSLELSPDNIVEKLGTEGLQTLMQLGRRVDRRKKKPDSPIDALALAKSLLSEILEGLYEGSGTCIGLPQLRANQLITIENVGKRFSGTYKIKQVTHTINSSGYRTSFQVTQRGSTNLLGLLRKEVSERPPPNQSPRFYGFVVGKVSNIVDPKGWGRVRVTYPWFSDTTESPWARVVTPMAGSNRGFYFLPDVGDEVMVGFQYGDFDKPVVLGGVWNGVNLPPQVATPINPVRTIKTGAGHQITLDDTTGNEQIVISHKGGSSITMKSDGDVVIDAKKNLLINAKNVEVSVDGTMDVS